MKYVVLGRDKNEGTIIESFGVYSRKRYANAMLNIVMKDACEGIEYCVEEVDPYGSFANDECDDECVE